MKKQILMVQHKDGTQEVTCPVCKSKMIFRDMGVSMAMYIGEVIEQDYGGRWDCQKCGYQSDE